MPALDAIEVEGYKSIRHAWIELGWINVLIGANGTGKSNLLGVFGLLADLAERRLQLHIGREGGADALLHFGRKRTSALGISLQHGDGRWYSARLVPSVGDTLVFAAEAPLSWSDLATHTLPVGLGDRLYRSGHKETRIDEDDLGLTGMPDESFVLPMRHWRPFHFHDSGRSAPARQKHKIDDNRALRPGGDNLAPFLLALSKIAPGAYRRIVETVRLAAPFFDDFALAPDVVNPEIVQLAWRHRSDDALFTGDALSDGTLRFIALATLLLQPELPSVLVIDEPELGLHPASITQLAALIRSAATRTQIVLATQSVTLLDQFEAADVIVVEQSHGASTFRRLDERALETWKQEYSLGELWLKNVLGGRP